MWDDKDELIDFVVGVLFYALMAFCIGCGIYGWYINSDLILAALGF